MTHRKPAVIFIFITLLLDVLGFGLLIPVAPQLVKELQGGTEADAAHAVGLLAVIFSSMMFLFSPTLGVLSDRFGRRPIILISLFGSGLDYFAMSMARTLPILYFTRALNGLSGASMTAANAYIADVTPPEKRAGAFGMVGAAFGLGFVLGPLMGGYFGDPNVTIPLVGPGNIRYPYYAAGGITLCNWLYGWFVLPESLPKEKRGHFTWRRANPVGAMVGLGRYPLVAGLAVAFFFSHVAQFGLHVTWVLYTSHRYGWTPAQVGLSLFAVGIGAAVVQGGLARKIIPMIGEKRAVLIGMGMSIFTFAGYGLASEGWMIFPLIAVGSLAGIGMPAAQAMITKTVRPYEQGAIQGAMVSLQSIAAIIGPIIGAGVYAYFITPPRNLPGAPFFTGAGLLVIAWLGAAWAIGKHGKHWEHAPKPEGLAGNSRRDHAIPPRPSTEGDGASAATQTEGA